MKISLKFIRETAAARFYQDKGKAGFWIPKSVITHTTKYTPKDGQPAVHDLTIEDWWWEQKCNPGTG
jgi:hypothetical protein